MGRPVHFEIHASDPAALQDFYSTVFGWSFQQWEDNPYWLVMTGEESEPGINGGLMPRQNDAPGMGASPNSWVVTVEVDDVQAYLDRAVEAGATQAMPKSPIPQMGWVAYAMDPDGNMFGLFQSDEAAG